MPLMPGAEPLAIDSTHPEYGRVGGAAPARLHRLTQIHEALGAVSG